MPNNMKIIVWVLSFTFTMGLVYIAINMNGATSVQQVDHIAKGKLVYNQYCASCHGENLQGQPNWKKRNDQDRLPAPPHDETGHTWHHSDQLLFDLTKFGMVPPNIPADYKSDMPAFEKVLTDDEIWDALRYIKSRWPEKTQVIQREINAEGTAFKKP